MAHEKPTIVVADDHSAILAKITNVLKSDYDVIAAVENGADAVRAVTEHQPDLVVLDIAMPRMDGFAAARKIRELGIPTKIVFLTAQISVEYLATAQSLDASFVLKNHLHSELLVAIKETLAGRIYRSAIPELDDE